MMKLFIFTFLLMNLLPRLSSANISCNSILNDSTDQLARVVLKLSDINSGEEKDSSEFAELSIKTLEKAIEHVSFKDIRDDALKQVREYLLSRTLTSRETLLLSIVEFNIIKRYSRDHIDTAIQTLKSLPAPLRRKPEFNWHLAEYYYASGDKEMAFELLLYILRTARLQPKTIVYLRGMDTELNKLSNLPIEELSKLGSLDPIAPEILYNQSNWGPYTRSN